MADDIKCLGVITARGGSKRLPGKNVKLIAGKPLLDWTVSAAKLSIYLNRLIISSDDDAILAQAERAGCEVPFKRDAALASDEATSIDVILDVLARVPGYDYIVLLQPTSPSRTTQDIDACIEYCIEHDFNSVVSVTSAQAGDSNICHFDVLPTPLQPPYKLNGAIYILKSAWVAKHKKIISDETIGYAMPAERSVDIDTQQDFDLAERYLSAHSSTMENVDAR